MIVPKNIPLGFLTRNIESIPNTEQGQQLRKCSTALISISPDYSEVNIDKSLRPSYIRQALQVPSTAEKWRAFFPHQMPL